jgi:hypothetical protein
MGYVMRRGRRIEIVTVNPDIAPKKKRLFEPRWVKLPRHWISGLGQSKSANTYRLALLILLEAYRDRRGRGEITLSTAMTGMPRNSRIAAARELAEIGLITLKEGGGNRALKARIIHLPYYDREESK